jgi:hypothetical protein
MNGTSHVAASDRIKRQSWIPDTPGIHKSAMIAAGGEASASSAPVAPSGAMSTT